MPRRSLLFSPGDSPDLMRKASRSDADVICFDLEDAVAPGRRDEARAAVRGVLSDPSFDPDAEVCVRLTAESPAADLDGVLGSDAEGGSDAEPETEPASGGDAVRLDAVMLPKVERADRVDDAADVGATRTDEGTEVLYAREHVVLAASAAGVDAIDTVYTDFSDEAGLREDAAFARRLGYDGKLAIHPAQVGPITEAFTPDPQDVEWAEAVLDARDEAEREGRAVFQVDGEMIDAPLIAQAERVLDRAPAGDR